MTPICFDRTVDWLLKVHSSTRDERVKAMTLEVLDDLRELGPDAVEGDMGDVVVDAIASIEIAVELVSEVAAA